MTKSTIKIQRLYQQVANELMSLIAGGKYVVGDRLPSERELAASFQVSRPTIREAVIALELAGMVEVRNGSGVYVIEKTSDALEPAEMDIGPFELAEARRLFEGESAALAAGLMTHTELEQLEATIQEMVEENEQNILGEKADRSFHVQIAQATQNSAIVMAIENLWDVRNHSPLCVRLFEKVRAQGVKPRIEEHMAIFEALCKRDPKAARAAMRDHLGRVIDGLLKATEIEAMEKTRTEIQRQRERLAKTEFT